MNIKLDIEATPAELRTFFGLPNIEPLQDELVERIRKNMEAGMKGFDAVSLMKPLLPAHLQSVENFQKLFWDSLTKGNQKVAEKKD
jgi:hypothetical protein